MQRKTKRRRKTGKRRVGRVVTVDIVGSTIPTLAVVDDDGAELRAALEASNDPRAGAIVVGNYEGELILNRGTEENELVRKMGDADQMNTVEVNEATLIAEANAAVENAPVEITAVDQTAEQAPREPTPEEVHKGYVMVAGAGLAWTAETFAPNWAVQPKEIDPVSDALANACMLWFPDQIIPPKYLALLVLAKSIADVVLARRDSETGVMRSLSAKKSTQPAQSEAA